MYRDELPSDEIRREIRAAEAINAAAMPRWRLALNQLFGDDRLTTDDRAAMLGVPSPSRRNFFRVGGGMVLGATVLAACGSDSKGTAATTAAPNPPTTPAAPAMTDAMTTPPMTDAMTTPPMTDAMADPASGDQDLVLARTAASLEKLAVDVYGQAAGLLKTAAILDAAKTFMDHHQQHLDALNGLITGAGGKAVDMMNQAVFDALVKPALDKAASEQDAVMLALSLEEAAAQTYAFAGGALSMPALRSTIMTIGGVEARHAAVLRMAALAQSPLDVFPTKRAFFPGSNPLAGIDGALIMG